MIQTSDRKITFFILGAIVIALLFSRFWKLSEVPVAFVHDEIIYLIQAQAVALSGSDITGTWNPSSLIPFNGAFSELPAVFLSLTVPYVTNPMVAGRLLHALMGICIPFILGWLTYGLWKNKKLSMIVLLISVCNPWLWQYSRMAFDSLFSIFFYLLAAAVLINAKSWWKLISVPLLVLGFYEYQGLKLAFIPFVIGITSLFLIKDEFNCARGRCSTRHASSIWIALIVISSSLALFSYYVFFALPLQQANLRMSQIRSLSSNETLSAVNTERRLSLNSPFSSITINKYLETSQSGLGAFFQMINPKFIFVTADEAANSFAASRSGYFYLIDLPLLFLGLYALTRSRSQRSINVIYILLLLMASIPAVMSLGQSYTFRASLFYVLLIPLVAHGVLYIVEKKKRLLSISLLGIYLFSVLMFAEQYFFQFPVYAADAQFFSERILANYIHRTPNTTPVYILVSDQEFMFNSYLYYNNLYTKSNVSRIQKAVNDKSFSLDNVHIIKDCTRIPSTEKGAILVISREMKDCEIKKDLETDRIISIPAISDGGELFRIKNDQVCNQITLPRYISPKLLSDFTVEKLSSQDFCQKWLTFQE